MPLHLHLTTSNKRSSIPAQRLKALQQPRAVYIITCHQEEYFCKDHFEGICRRGFFSLFLQAVYGIHFAKKLNIPYHIDFGNLNYSYSDKMGFQGNPNFWDYFFIQELLPVSARKVLNTRFENFPLKIWDKSFIRELHKTALEIKLNEVILPYVEQIKKEFDGLRILGIHIRKTDHAVEVVPLNDNKYFKLVNKYVEAFDKLFIATDDEGMLAEFKLRYPDKLLYHPFSRSSGNDSLHGSPPPSGGYILGKEALLDCYSLSFCDQAILSPSNLSYCSLLINPDLPYHLAESIAAGWKRRKTLAAYYMDKWGIRKW